MAHHVLTIDQCPASRRQFLERATAQLRGYSNLVVSSHEVGDLAIAWGTGRQAPYDVDVASDALSLQIGYAISDAGQRVDANQLARDHRTQASRFRVCDGYFVHTSFSKEAGLVLSVDPFGLFPLYYGTEGDTLLAGTTPNLFEAHPNFKAALDPVGLAGILLTNGLVSNRPLVANTRRVPAGCHLDWQPDQGCREVNSYQLQPTDTSPIDTDRAGELVAEEFQAAIRRHAPDDTPTTLLLSGGLDSRLVAAMLHAEGLSNTAVCFGSRHDYERRAASRVANELEIDLHGSRELNDAEFVDAARNVAEREQLSAGFASLSIQDEARQVGELAPFCWSGYILDDTLGGFALNFGRNAPTNTPRFDFCLGWLGKWGVSPDTLASLLDVPDGTDLVRSLMDDLHADYYAGDVQPCQRAFRLKLAQRGRFHLGAVLHRISFQSWPLLPNTDRRVLELIYSLDPDVTVGRKIELDSLARLQPKLLDIPFDTNSFAFSRFIKGGIGRRAVGGITTWVATSCRRWYWRHLRKHEPRRYVRYYDLDAPLWQAVRRVAEPHRGLLAEWLQPSVVNQLLPPPGVRLQLQDPFAAGGSRRALLGLMLWSASREGSSRQLPQRRAA